MIVLLDTSVVVAALVEAHPRHAGAFVWLHDVRAAEVQGLIAAHSIAETYAVLTTLPLSPRIAPSAAWALIHHSILPFVRTAELSSAAVREVVERLSRQGLAGGIVYDALIAEAAIRAGAEVLVTLNRDDFQRVTRESQLVLQEP